MHTDWPCAQPSSWLRLLDLPPRGRRHKRSRTAARRAWSLGPLPGLPRCRRHDLARRHRRRRRWPRWRRCSPSHDGLRPLHRSSARELPGRRKQAASRDDARHLRRCTRGGTRGHGPVVEAGDSGVAQSTVTGGGTATARGPGIGMDSGQRVPVRVTAFILGVLAADDKDNASACVTASGNPRGARPVRRRMPAS